MFILLVIGANAPFKVVLMIVSMSLHVLGLSIAHGMQAGVSCAIHGMFSQVIAVWMDRQHGILTRRLIQQSMSWLQMRIAVKPQECTRLRQYHNVPQLFLRLALQKIMVKMM